MMVESHKAFSERQAPRFSTGLKCNGMLEEVYRAHGLVDLKCSACGFEVSVRESSDPDRRVESSAPDLPF